MRNLISRSVVILALFNAAIFSSNASAFWWWFFPSPDIPESKKAPANRIWTEAQVDAVVDWNQVTISSPLGLPGLPAACDNITFSRYFVANGPSSSDADAVFMMMPGVLEGASAFHHIARHMLYIAKQEHNKNFEVWALDRRSNCLEDFHGINAIANINDSTEATRVLSDYYLAGKEVDGKVFDGFLESSELPGLASFGMKLSTEDMFTIMNTMMPDINDRQEKLFVGGHSLGGIHTSIFLAWDLDNNPQTLDDAGYNNVAGAFAFDSIVSDLSTIPDIISSMVPFDLATFGIDLNEIVSPELYSLFVKGVEKDIIPRTTTIPGLFTPQEIAFPVMIGAIAQKGPEEENFAISEIPINTSLGNIMRVLHSQNGWDFIFPPELTDFRYTNAALVGLIFDDDFSTIGFLGTSLGHLSGGTVEKKSPFLNLIAQFPFVGNLVAAISTDDQQFIATEDDIWGRGPLYSWANFDEVANNSDTKYKSTNGKVLYTTKADEMVDINNFINTLHESQSNTNFTEWYFPTRIVLDAALGVPFEHAVESGLAVHHPEGCAEVPKIEFIGNDGVIKPIIDLGVVPLTDNVVFLEGQNHLDPMYEVVNAPSRHEPVVIPKLIEFALENIN